MFALLLLPAAGESPAQSLPAPTTFELSLTCGVPSGPCNFVREDDGPTTNATTTITVTAAYPAGTSTPTTETVLTITVTGTVAVAAIEGTDFTSVPAFNLTIPADARMVTGTFDFESIADTTPELGGRRVTVTPTTTATSITGTLVAVTFVISDNDTEPFTIVSSLDTTSVTEGSGTTTIAITVAFAPGSRVSSAVLDVPITVSDGTTNGATAGEDYTAVAPFTITIAAGDLEATGSFVLTVNDDTVLETTPETIIITPNASGFTELPLTLTIEIVDNEVQADTITLSLDPSQCDRRCGHAHCNYGDGEHSGWHCDGNGSRGDAHAGDGHWRRHRDCHG